MKILLKSRWGLALRTAPFVAAAVAAKVLVDQVGWEGLEFNTLYSSLVAANVFLLGFLLAGTLADYKEAEKLPGDLATSLEAIADECDILYRSKGAGPARECVAHLLQLGRTIDAWLHRRERADAVLDGVSGLNTYFLAFEELTQPNFIVRLKQEQNAVRRVVTRMHTIRDTTFVGAAYAIAELASILLLAALVTMDFASTGEEVFLVGIIAFVLVYLLLLIRDLDDPFDYSGNGVADVTLHPIEHARERMEQFLAEMDTPKPATPQGE